MPSGRLPEPAGQNGAASSSSGQYFNPNYSLKVLHSNIDVACPVTMKLFPATRGATPRYSLITLNLGPVISYARRNRSASSRHSRAASSGILSVIFVIIVGIVNARVFITVADVGLDGRWCRFLLATTFPKPRHVSYPIINIGTYPQIKKEQDTWSNW